MAKGLMSVFVDTQIFQPYLAMRWYAMAVLGITSRGDLSDIQFKRLAAGIEYNLDDVELLVCQVIPSLEEKVEVKVSTERLPKALSVQPYLLIDSEQNGRELILKPKIAYGDPMVAWVRGDHLEVEGEYVPIRRLREEKKIRKTRC